MAVSGMQIRKVAVLGAGTMGSRIAAHVANAGVPVVLLDIVPPGTAADAPISEKNKFVIAAMEGLKKSKPAAFYAAGECAADSDRNFEDDLALVKDCDWILEVVAENLEIKRALLARVLEHRRAGSILTSNTSGIPIGSIAAGLSDEARSHFFGTHFFNPPRYMRLLEIIPTPETDAADVAAISQFCDTRLGKTVVRSHDTPNFIANRIGTFSMGNAIRLMMAQGLTIEEVDTLTGAALGWPKTGTFRLGDMVGVDVLAHVATNFSAKAESIEDERQDVMLAPFITAMLEKKWLGDKVGQGFYKKQGKDEQGRDVRLVLDWKTLEYGPSTRPKFQAIEMAKNVEATPKRVAQLLHGQGRGEGQGCGVLLAAADGVVYLCSKPDSAGEERDCGLDCRDRPGDEDGLQLGAGAFRDVRCGGGEGDDGEDAGGGAAGFGECRKAARKRWGELV